MARERMVIVKAGDSWDAIAARELGNKTLASEVAGWNGASEVSAPPVGAKIRILGAGGEDTGSTDTANTVEDKRDREDAGEDAAAGKAKAGAAAVSDSDRAELEQLRAEKQQRDAAAAGGQGI